MRNLIFSRITISFINIFSPQHNIYYIQFSGLLIILLRQISLLFFKCWQIKLFRRRSEYNFWIVDTNQLASLGVTRSLTV